MTYYELLQDNTIGRSTNDPTIADTLGLSLKTDKKIVYGYDNKRYFETEVPLPPEPDYEEKRLLAYPDFRDYLDAQVKLNSSDPLLQTLGQQQLEKYVADCLAVKEQYPKV